jgi:hypothetical protein
MIADASMDMVEQFIEKYRDMANLTEIAWSSFDP